MHRRSVAGWMMGVLLAGMAAAQPVQWRVEDEGNGHWYQIVRVPQGLLWLDAVQRASAFGGHLASFTSSEEWNFFKQLWSPALAGGNLWLGGEKPDGTTLWRWNTSEAWTFSAWGSGGCPFGPYPNNPQSAHLALGVSIYCGMWDDHNIFAKTPADFSGFVIEWSADCNNDGIVDKGQILSGELPDANNNGIPDGGPTITSQPIDQNVGVDVPVTFIVEVGADPACTTPVTFQWQRRNPLVADPAAANAWIDLADGNGFLNTRTPGLIIVRPTPGLATGYRCKMSGGCGGCEPGQGGFVCTNTVNFTIACPSDFNADGGVDFGDLELFFERWENGC